ncbi:MAG: 2-amino-4-hydroxy-6-hydroxymethyldihydropteridine diphosphokinase [Bacteroidota bacterium]
MITSKLRSKEADREKHAVYLGLGSNVGDRLAFLSEAVRRLNALPGTAVLQVSSIYETEPVGFKDQGDFLNLVLELESSLEPMELLNETKHIEKSIGRRDDARWHPREIDIDILLYDELIFRSERLFIPHREMLNRKFVLVPLSEIAGTVIHPIEKMEVHALLHRCKDSSRVTKTEFKLNHT